MRRRAHETVLQSQISCYSHHTHLATFLIARDFQSSHLTLITKALFLCLLLLLVMQFEGNLIIIINNHKTEAFTKQPLYFMQSLKVRGGIALTTRLIIEQREDRKTLGSRHHKGCRCSCALCGGGRACGKTENYQHELLW